MIPLSAQTNQAVAMLSRMAEACAHDTEAHLSELAAAANLDEKAAQLVLSELERAGLIIEGFDAGGYRLTREPSAMTMFDVAVVFEKALQNNLSGITRALRPTVEAYFRSITFAACAGSCPSESGKPEDQGNCPRTRLAQDQAAAAESDA